MSLAKLEHKKCQKTEQKNWIESFSNVNLPFLDSLYIYRCVYWSTLIQYNEIEYGRTVILQCIEKLVAAPATIDSSN